MDPIKTHPTPGLSYNPSDEKYWDEKGLHDEIERVFDICHGCRLCFNLCPSFPALFDAIDANDGDVRALGAADVERVVDLCYQCKLCYVKCPYTADDGHEFQLDFPRLLMRYTAQRTRRRGVRPRERMLGDPMRLGRLATRVARLANWANATRFHRLVLEKMAGIHRDKLLPDFASQTFGRWWSRRGARPATARQVDEVVLFHTCFVEYNNPDLGRDAVEVLERSGVRVLVPEQTCCGMPALDGGDVDFAREQARRNVAVLAPYADRGCSILAINPTCSYTLRKEYPELVGADMEAAARKVATATHDLMEYIHQLRRNGHLDTSFRSTPGAVAYHVPCHLKAQNIGFRSRDAMKAVPGATVRVVDGCCGHDGTWAMKTENFALSMQVGKATFEAMQEGGVMATDCPLAAIQFEQATGTRPMHPVQVLALSYRENGFPTPVPPREDEAT
ncbi:MAG TPA: anaerobic glycerol-3-phosphate dehydrogenase subunit C [Candidatus Limnocylindrales bacterium]|nr:anaerobic glycerol-3-phosphate dehydrogenase subunit C [Candidatus Limnocylindrales bacterium]